MNNLKDKIICLRMSRQDLKKIKKQAENMHLTISAYMRMQLLNNIGNE